MSAIEIIGVRSEKYHYVKKSIELFVKFNGLSTPVIEINSIESIIKERVTSIPTVKFQNAKLVFDSDVNTSKELSRLFSLLTDFKDMNTKTTISCTRCMECSCTSKISE